MTDKRKLEGIINFLEIFANDIFTLLDNIEEDQGQGQEQSGPWSDDYVDQRLEQEPLSRRIH